MKVLILEWKAFGQLEIKDALNELGHSYVTHPFDYERGESDLEYQHELINAIQNISPDLVFSFNYFAVISIACNSLNIKYASWIYDSPYVQLYSCTIINPCNYVFVFDKALYNEFHSNGIHTVFYLPLAADAKRLSQMTDFETFRQTPQRNETDIAFVGQLYTEKSQMYSQLRTIRPYTRGYIEAIMSVQKNVYGYNFIKDILPSGIIEDMSYDIHMTKNPNGIETDAYLFAQYVLNRQITASERTETLIRIGSKYKYDLYTTDAYIRLPNCINHGTVSVVESAPYVYKSAKINLNITLRSITTGIPLRAFEIMGCEGFCLSNYQADFGDCYIANEDYVYYENLDDMMDKIDYYLTHEKERAEIAHNGFLRTLNCHSYTNRIQTILETIANN